MDIKWQEAVDLIAAGVVSVNFCHTRYSMEKVLHLRKLLGLWSMDRKGYVQDSAIERKSEADICRYIFTNRHVAGPNPFWGR